MKEIVFRPLRRIKKTGKICVASYIQWYKVRCADYSQFKLTIDDEYKILPSDEYVYNHKGERLFWRDYNPSDIKIYYHDSLRLTNEFDNFDDNISFFGQLSELHKKTGYGILWSFDGKINYNCKGLDCCGTPTFSHGTEHQITIGNMCSYTLENIHEQLDPFKDYEPLTVGMVTKWFGWFLYQLENSQLQIKK